MESTESSVVHMIASLLLNAATSRRLVTYKRFHAFFDANVPLTTRYRLLARAVGLLSDCRQLDYGVLLTLEGGLPGEDFVARFKSNRRGEFESVMGAGSLGRSKTKRKILASLERERVFEHARQSEVPTTAVCTAVTSHVACARCTEEATDRRSGPAANGRSSIKSGHLRVPG